MIKSTIAICLVVLMNSTLAVFAQMQPKFINGERKSPPSPRSFVPIKPKLNKEQKQKLLPNSIDLSKYSEFLKQPKTGLIRLYPDLDCESAYILRADQVCAESIFGSSYYSFREREYTNDFLSDIRLKSKVFITDGVLTQSFMVNLGNISLENISLNSDGMKFVNDFEPEAENRDALAQYNQLAKGIRVGKYEYRKFVPAFENTTYAMRLVAYKANLFTTYLGWRYNVLEGDNRTDMTIAFRVVRKDEDGSVSLLWKELERRKAVRIKISKPDERRN